MESGRFRRRRQQNFHLRHGLTGGVEDHSGDRPAWQETEILGAGRIVADAELRAVLRAVAWCLDAQPQRNVGARSEIIQSAGLALLGVVAFRDEPVLAEHVDGDDGEGGDWLARHRIRDATGDAMIDLQYDGTLGSTAGDFQIAGGEASRMDS